MTAVIYTLTRRKVLQALNGPGRWRKTYLFSGSQRVSSVDLLVQNFGLWKCWPGRLDQEARPDQKPERCRHNR